MLKNYLYLQIFAFINYQNVIYLFCLSCLVIKLSVCVCVWPCCNLISSFFLHCNIFACVFFSLWFYGVSYYLALRIHILGIETKISFYFYYIS